jgi:hypothetical protein
MRLGRRGSCDPPLINWRLHVVFRIVLIFHASAFANDVSEESNEAVADVCYFVSNLSMKNSTSDSYFGFAPGYFK